MTDEWKDVNAEYEAIHRELMNIRMQLGIKPWEPSPDSRQFVNTHPVNSPEHGRLQAIIRHYRERSARCDAIGKRIEELRKERIAASIAAARVTA